MYDKLNDNSWNWDNRSSSPRSSSFASSSSSSSVVVCVRVRFFFSSVTPRYTSTNSQTIQTSFIFSHTCNRLSIPEISEKSAFVPSFTFHLGIQIDSTQRTESANRVINAYKTSARESNSQPFPFCIWTKTFLDRFGSGNGDRNRKEPSHCRSLARFHSTEFHRRAISTIRSASNEPTLQVSKQEMKNSCEVVCFTWSTVGGFIASSSPICAKQG